MDKDDIWKVVIKLIVVGIAIFISLNFTKCVVESDIPTWLKIWILR